METTPDQRPQPRRRDPALMALLKMRYDECELTGLTFNLHLHHVVFRAQGGDDVRANIVCMNAGLHERYHRGDAAAKLLLGTHIWFNRPDTLEYLQQKLTADSWTVWLEDHGIEE